jgi:cystathionine beta-lyase/cystathionine gamma-synthase
MSTLAPDATLYLAGDTYLGARALAQMLANEQKIRLRLLSPLVLRDGSWLSEASAGDLLMCESPSNPSLNVYDLPRLIDGAHAKGVMVSVDNTFATPLAQRPLALGADVVVHSATKFIAGHSDVLAGVVVTRSDSLASSIRTRRSLYGTIIGPMESYLVERGLKTLSIRLERAAENALRVAEYLEHRLGVGTTRYPGLPSHPDHELAAAQLGSFGAIVTADFGSAERAERFLGALRVFHLATSLGAVESLAERRAQYPLESDQPPGLVRFSCGIEPYGLLEEDIERGLEAVTSASA